MAKGKYHDWLTEDALIRIQGWARDGLTDEQIAKNMGINVATLYDWKKKFSNFSEALKRGKEVIDRIVENALLKRALGYKYTEVTKERIVDTGQKLRHENGVELTEQQWELCKAYFSNTCAYCGDASTLTKDHVDPLANGGRLNISNVVPACKSCNSSKKDSNWLAWYQKQDFYDKEKAKKICDYLTFTTLLPKSVDRGELVVTKEITKEVAPDVTAQIYWLNNRKPGEWRNRREHDVKLDVDRSDRLDAILEQLGGEDIGSE